MTKALSLETAIRQQVDAMTPEQFSAYERAVRSSDPYSMTPEAQANFALTVRAVNARRVRDDQPLSVTIRDGIRNPGIPWVWIIGGAIGAAIMLRTRR